VVVAGCSTSPREHFEAGNKYFAEGKYREAAIEFRNAVKADPKFGEAELKLGEAQLRLGDGPRALRSFVRAADLLPASAEAQVRAGGLLLLASQFAEAKGRADKALAIDAKRVDALVLRANALAGLSDLDAALANLGALRLVRGERREAEEAYRSAIEKSPTSVDAHLALANFLWATGRLPEAEAGFKAALALEPGRVLTNRALAAFCVASQRPAEAEPYLKRVAEASREPGPKLDLANYYVAMNRPDEAVRLLESISAMRGRFPRRGRSSSAWWRRSRATSRRS
jgi:tetratricopeptide (TPR) repeat protein